jgi:hypothetical protein
VYCKELIQTTHLILQYCYLCVQVLKLGVNIEFREAKCGLPPRCLQSTGDSGC